MRQRICVQTPNGGFAEIAAKCDGNKLWTDGIRFWRGKFLWLPW